MGLRLTFRIRVADLDVHHRQAGQSLRFVEHFTEKVNIARVTCRPLKGHVGPGQRGMTWRSAVSALRFYGCGMDADLLCPVAISDTARSCCRLEHGAAGLSAIGF